MANLSHRQAAVLVGLNMGLTTVEISRRMGVSHRTILRDVSVAKTFLGIRQAEFTAVTLVRRALEAQVIDNGLRLDSNGRVGLTVAAVVRGGPRI